MLPKWVLWACTAIGCTELSVKVAQVTKAFGYLLGVSASIKQFDGVIFSPFFSCPGNALKCYQCDDLLPNEPDCDDVIKEGVLTECPKSTEGDPYCDSLDGTENGKP